MTRRLLRYAFEVLAVMSLLLSVAVVGLWVWSYHAKSAVDFSAGGVLWQVASDRGWLSLDNEPQRELEAKQADLVAERLIEERKRLDQEFDLLRARYEQTSPDQRAALWPDITLLFDLIRANRDAYAASGPAAQGRSPRVAHAVPHWFVAAAAAVPTAVLLAPAAVERMRRRRRYATGLCGGCAYDLRGNVSGICPECGRAVPKGDT